MLTRLHILIFATLLILAMIQATNAAQTGNQLEVSIEVRVNPVEGSARTGCETSAKVETGRQEWWVAFAQAKPHPEKDWEPVDRKVGCGGSYDKGVSDFGTPPGAPYLIGRLSTVAGLLPSHLIPERVILLNIALTLQKLSGFGKGGEPVYQDSKVKRTFYFLEGGNAFVPLLVASAREQEALGIHEVFLRVAARQVNENSASAAYGVVSVTSGLEGAEVLLDGGRVGKIVAGSATTLRNVPVGWREVRVRDAAGREVRKAMRVEANRTVLVDLSLPDPATDTVAYRLVPLGRNAQGYEEYRRETDGAMVVKIPAGDFLMGNKETEGSPLEHQVYVSDFLIDKTGVTWGQYKKYLERTGIPLPPRDLYWGIHDDHPAVYVTWEEAKTYCEWAGGRLPTEAEREKAARGSDRRKYPWGNEEPDPQRGVYRHRWGYEATEPVGTHPAGVSPYGLLDMGGNVWEWCSDWWDRDYFEVSPYRDPKGPATGIAHVLKGGSWDSRPSVLSSSSRNFGYRGYRDGDFGFRCAMNAPR